MKYEITYTESYARTYWVEANSKDEAIEQLEEDIKEGRVAGPDDCYDSDYHVVEVQ